MKKIERVKIKCHYCNKEFEIKPLCKRERNFCSKECYYKFRSEYYTGEKVYNKKIKSEYTCSYCRKIFYSLPSAMKGKKNTFCSKDCRFNFDKQEYKGEKNPNFKGGKIKLACLNCGELFEIERARLGRAKYCSLKCKDEYWSTTLSKTPENIERLRNHGIKTKKEQNNKFTKPERIVLEFLQKKEILFLPQFPMYDMFVVDFFLPDQNLVIEVLGDYWHGNPIKYKVPNDMQKKHQDRDSFKEKTLLEKGHKVLMIWETDIYKNIEDALNVLN